MTSVDDWQAVLYADYNGIGWCLNLSDEKYFSGFSFKFLLNGEPHDGVPITVPPGAACTYEYGDADAPVARTQPFGPLPERGRLQARYFPSAPPVWEPEVLVIGSGMGGGVLAERLSDLGIKVLVLEAGGLLFPTHVGNLPRRQNMGAFDKHLWQLWPDFQSVPYASDHFRGGQGFNLGGRSIFWGGFIPRMTSWELDFWPSRLKWDLEDTYYDMAEAVLGRSTNPSTMYARLVKAALAERFPEYSLNDAPMAIQVRSEGSNAIPAGLFSTADLLIESALTSGCVGGDNLKILLNHDVKTIRPERGRSVVEAYDILGKRSVTFRAHYVVLAAGTIESAKIAARSGLSDPSGLIGRGITDHPVYYSHFVIRSESEYYDPFGNVKTLLQPKEDNNKQRDPFNVLLELGADFNHGRYLDEAILLQHIRRRDHSMLCEIVFLCNEELDNANYIRFANDGGPEHVIMAPTRLNESVLKRIYQVRDIVLSKLHGEVIVRPDGARDEGFGYLGAVAHEVGTLRMRVYHNARIRSGLMARSEGLVDENGRWFGVEHLYVCDLSTFPTSPAANPSLTLVAMALRMADHLQAELSRSHRGRRRQSTTE
jgi:choline dehydrogenase-like flavoprotein